MSAEASANSKQAVAFFGIGGLPESMEVLRLRSSPLPRRLPANTRFVMPYVKKLDLGKKLTDVYTPALAYFGTHEHGDACIAAARKAETEAEAAARIAKAEAWV